MPKNVQTTTQLHSSHMLVKWCSKFSKSGFKNTWTVNFLIFKLVLEKAEEPEIKLLTSAGSAKRHESSRKKSISVLLTMSKPLTVFSSVQSLSRVWLCDPMNHSMPGLPIHHQLPESTQIHVHWVGDAIQPSCSLSSPSPPALNLSQHRALFKRISSSHQVAKLLEFQLQPQSFQWTPRTDLL